MLLSTTILQGRVNVTAPNVSVVHGSRRIATLLKRVLEKLTVLISLSFQFDFLPLVGVWLQISELRLRIISVQGARGVFAVHLHQTVMFIRGLPSRIERIGAMLLLLLVLAA